MVSFYRKLLKNFESLSRSFGVLPRVPSEADKKILKKLERLKVDDPFNSLYNVKDRAPVTSGVSPERIVVEVREYQKFHFITYWYFWTFDRFLGDHENWEPVTLVYKADELTRIYARVHDALISYTRHVEDIKPKVYFYRIGHTPIVRVRDRKKDILLEKLNDGLDYTRKKWLDLCYQHAENNGWLPLAQPQLECENGPILDENHWRSWGKHSIYLRI